MTNKPDEKKSKKPEWVKPHKCKHCKAVTSMLMCQHCGRLST